MDSAEALSDAVLAIAAEHAVEPVLQKLVDAARELAGARYAAIGVPDGDGGFAQFITSGMSDELIASLGPLPRTHGLLGAMLEPDAAPQRTLDIRRDPRFRGWWPKTHPSMSSFLGVPIVARGHVAGAFYLTDKDGGFSDDDQALIETFAAHAALAIENARLHERSRELSIVEERNRLARELHDAVAQKLFGVVLAAESGTRAARARRRGRGAQLRARARARGRGDGGAALGHRPPAPAGARGRGARGRARQARRRPAPRAPPRDRARRSTATCPVPARIETDVFRIAQEALHNALRHADAEHIALRLRCATTGASSSPSPTTASASTPSDGALAPPRADDDGRARAGDRRRRCASTPRPAPARP